MKHQHPFRLLKAITAISLLLLTGIALAQPSGGPPGEPGPPGGDDGPPWGGPPPWAGEPGPPPHAGGGDDDDEEEGDEEGNEDEGGIPDFCSGGPQPGGPDGQAGMSSIAHLNFSQKDPDTGEAIEDGAWARVMYRWMAPMWDFVFNAHALPPGDDYSFVYVPEPLGETDGVICFATGTVNEDGDLHLEDAFDIDTDLPAEYDANEDEATLALVPTVDVDCEAGSMNAWNPADYVMADEGMFYVDSDLEDEEEEEGEG
jgi:hypothetical protein